MGVDQLNRGEVGEMLKEERAVKELRSVWRF
jgi:hypothetical protein